MKTYVLWLEDTAINKISKEQRNYPPQYDSEKLGEILNGCTVGIFFFSKSFKSLNGIFYLGSLDRVFIFAFNTKRAT